MGSRKNRNRRSRSPRRDDSRQPSSHRDYRERDDPRQFHGDSWRPHGYPSEPSPAWVQTQTVYYGNGSGPPPPTQGHWGQGPPPPTYGDRFQGQPPPTQGHRGQSQGRRHDNRQYRDDDRYRYDDRYRDDDRSQERGRSRQPRQRESSQPGQASRGSMGPPASTAPLATNKPGRAGSKQPRQYETVPTIPEKLRDKCGACSEKHDIRFCPYPNTEDGRTKICPICNRASHAWFECYFYNREVVEQFNICYENRRFLPTLVHNENIKMVLMNKVTLSTEMKRDNGQETLDICNVLPGPLSPAFVKKLMPTQVTDPDIQRQVSEGRCAPWDLVPRDLLDRAKRAEKAFYDPSTAKVTMESIIEDITSEKGKTPRARKLDYFEELHRANQARDASFAQANTTKPPSGPALTIRSRTSEARKKLQSRMPDIPDEEMDTECANCDSSGHKLLECPSPCKACGRRMAEHGVELNGTECTAGCLCKPNPGHGKSDCTKLCRPCLVLNKDSSTAIKDCTIHCPVHITMDGTNHSRCKQMARICNACQGKHWFQDCIEFLGRICPFCRKVDCGYHCSKCDAPSLDYLNTQIFQDKPEEWAAHIEEVYNTWHIFLDRWQWDKIVFPESDMKTSPWAMLRCKRHSNVRVDINDLQVRRQNIWKGVVELVKSFGGFKEALLPIMRLVTIPECRDCFNSHYIPEPAADFDSQTPGTRTEAAENEVNALCKQSTTGEVS